MSRPAYLIELLETGNVAHSSVHRSVLRELQSMDLVAVQSHKSRRRVVVTNSGAFAAWLDARYPLAPSNLDQLLTRAQNVARSRSSKIGTTTHHVQPILLKWFGLGDLEPMHLTARFGLLAAASNRVDNLPWPTVWYMLLVENWESFYSLNYQPRNIPIVAVYLGGHVPDATLEVLAGVTPPPHQSLCFVDYDWSGLQIYARVRSYFPGIDLYIPSDLDVLFARYAHHNLATTQTLFLGDDPASQRVTALIQQYNAGLEQEIVPPPSYTAFDESNSFAESST